MANRRIIDPSRLFQVSNSVSDDGRFSRVYGYACERFRPCTEQFIQRQLDADEIREYSEAAGQKVRGVRIYVDEYDGRSEVAFITTEKKIIPCLSANTAMCELLNAADYIWRQLKVEPKLARN